MAVVGKGGYTHPLESASGSGTRHFRPADVKRIPGNHFQRRRGGT
jgi:hypothetical protein